MMIELTQDLLRELFDLRNGDLHWKVSGKGRKIGEPAGHIRKDGYRSIHINGKHYFTHRLIFLYHHGYLPEYLDHIDGNSLNNDISNLREATILQNGMNQKKHKSYNGRQTTSKYKGVSWFKRIEKWEVQIQVNGKRKRLGYFTSEINAALAYDEVAIKECGEFVKTNAMMFPEIFKTKGES